MPRKPRITKILRRSKAPDLETLRNWHPSTERVPAPLLQAERVHLFQDVFPVLPDAPWSALVGLPMLGFGLYRVCFLDPDDQGRVIKVPRNQQGIDDNITELGFTLHPHPEIQIPRFEWAGGQWTPFMALRAERVKRIFPEPRNAFTPEDALTKLGLPDWTYSIDARQIGYTADGRLVAFDMGR